MYLRTGMPALAVLAAFSLATPALSQTSTAIPAKAYGPVWTGFYVGAAFGGGALVNKVNSSAGGASLNLDGLGSSGVLGSIYGGVDYQVLPKAIIGALAEATWSGFQSSASAQVPGAGATANTSAGLGWSVLARAGFLANPSTLLYLVGGYTGQNITTSGTAVAGGAVASFSSNDTVHGWTVGPGFETMLTGGWSAKLEYRYSQFGTTTPSGTDDQRNALDTGGPRRPLLQIWRPCRAVVRRAGHCLPAGEDQLDRLLRRRGRRRRRGGQQRLHRFRRRLDLDYRCRAGPARLGLRRRRLPVRAASPRRRHGRLHLGRPAIDGQPVGRRRQRHHRGAGEQGLERDGPPGLPADAVDTALCRRRLRRAERHLDRHGIRRRRQRFRLAGQHLSWLDRRARASRRS